MARQIYSFTKIEKKRTNAGLITMIVGLVTMAVLVGALVAAVLLKGKLPYAVAGVALISGIVALGSFIVAGSARRDDDSFGSFLNAGYIVSFISLCAHLLIFLIGVLIIIV